MNYTNDQYLCGNINNHQMGKLFTTFVKEENLEETIKEITRRYSILYNKIFVLKIEGKDELICTYNIDSFNISDNDVMPNTILLHRKKQSNTLYSINSLNALVKELNLGKIDSSYPIDWDDYKNTILLVSDGKLNKHTTKIFSIINL
jgi:hypothetical protein